MKKLFKTTITLSLGLYILCTSISTYASTNVYPSHESQVTPSSYDEVEEYRHTIF